MVETRKHGAYVPHGNAQEYIDGGPVNERFDGGIPWRLRRAPHIVQPRLMLRYGAR